MRKSDIEFRKVERDAICRCCYKIIKKNTEDAVIWYSRCNTGLNIILCTDCVRRLNEIVGEKDVLSDS